MMQLENIAFQCRHMAEIVGIEDRRMRRRRIAARAAGMLAMVALLGMAAV